MKIRDQVFIGLLCFTPLINATQNNMPSAAGKNISPSSGETSMSTTAVKDIQVYGHRGMRSFAPESTLLGYQSALRVGVDWLDMDIVLTKEGEVLVSHDLTLNSNIVRDPKGNYVPAGKYVVKDMALAELEKFDVGRLNPHSPYAKFFPDQMAVDGLRMPTFLEVVRYVKKTTNNQVGFQIEMKTDPTRPEQNPDIAAFAAAVYKILKDENIIDNTEVQAFDFRCLYELQKLDSRIKTAYLTSRDNKKGGIEDFLSNDPKIAGLWTGGKLLKNYDNSIPKMIKALGGHVWGPEDFQLTKEALDEAHRLGLKVVVWSWPEKLGTAFDPKLVAKMIDWGVDGIITDDPNRLSSTLAVRGLRLPNRYPASYSSAH